ncbi:flagellar biosynthetic protein FliO [Sinomonas atrocyanea]|uniref:flagellar biosynthetic protein FliO n=1 Tax=Sinomonas atrocyanea TaxID=37927 RepID=UPI00278ACEE9|nr:flagellar biosynthetic protein FliO [Sinomonas atrocyanea]MDQ0259559.1 flagellar protein FliO/FliZ [Sinomonas atrocyanea]MDR6623182.1 flagellar protein FliO/FliZ [Sinomonas atrocyanea]
MDSLMLGLRVLVSLGAVLGVMWLLYRRLRRGPAAAKGRPLSVVSRQSVGPKASVVLVDTDGKRFMLGVTEHGISVLHTAEAPAPEPVEAEAPAAATRRAARHAASFDAELAAQQGRLAEQPAPLAGSILDPGTWRLAAGALRAGRRP